MNPLSSPDPSAPARPNNITWCNPKYLWITFTNEYQERTRRDKKDSQDDQKENGCIITAKLQKMGWLPAALPAIIFLALCVGAVCESEKVFSGIQCSMKAFQ